jgi:hypothetical protein
MLEHKLQRLLSANTTSSRSSSAVGSGPCFALGVSVAAYQRLQRCSTPRRSCRRQPSAAVMTVKMRPLLVLHFFTVTVCFCAFLTSSPFAQRCDCSETDRNETLPRSLSLVIVLSMRATVHENATTTTISETGQNETLPLSLLTGGSIVFIELQCSYCPVAR